MYSEVLHTPFTNRNGGSLLPQIKAEPYELGQNDVTMTAVATALLARRTEHVVDIRIHQIGLLAKELPDLTYTNLFPAEKESDDDTQIVVTRYQGTEKEYDDVISWLDANDARYLPGFHRFDDLAKFCEEYGQRAGRRLKLRIYTNEERKTTLILLEDSPIGSAEWHLVTSFLPRYVPWLFEKEPYDAEETAVLSALHGANVQEFNAALEVLTSRYDLREARIRDQMSGIEERLHEKQLEGVREELESRKRELEDWKERFSTICQRIDELTTRETGLIQRIGTGSEESPLMDYFIDCPSLHVLDNSGDALQFVVTGVIANYDPDLASDAIRNHRSFFYRHYQNYTQYADDITDDQIELLVTALFVDETMRLRVCAAYDIDFSQNICEGVRGFDFGPEFSDYTPNQHIQTYACLGNNERPIYDALGRRDYVGVVMCCQASAANFNMAEANTGTYFMEQILASDAGKIIEMPDGTIATPRDAIAWLEAQKEETK